MDTCIQSVVTVTMCTLLTNAHTTGQSLRITVTTCTPDISMQATITTCMITAIGRADTNVTITFGRGIPRRARKVKIGRRGLGGDVAREGTSLSRCQCSGITTHPIHIIILATCMACHAILCHIFNIPSLINHRLTVLQCVCTLPPTETNMANYTGIKAIVTINPTGLHLWPTVITNRMDAKARLTEPRLQANTKMISTARLMGPHLLKAVTNRVDATAKLMEPRLSQAITKTMGGTTNLMEPHLKVIISRMVNLVNRMLNKIGLSNPTGPLHPGPFTIKDQKGTDGMLNRCTVSLADTGLKLSTNSSAVSKPTLPPARDPKTTLHYRILMNNRVLVSRLPGSPVIKL